MEAALRRLFCALLLWTSQISGAAFSDFEMQRKPRLGFVSRAFLASATRAFTVREGKSQARPGKGTWRRPDWARAWMYRAATDKSSSTN